MANWLVEDRDEYPVVYQTYEVPGTQHCGCCVVFRTREEAKVLELELLRGRQKRILAELAVCENRIVTVMRELDYTADFENFNEDGDYIGPKENN